MSTNSLARSTEAEPTKYLLGPGDKIKVKHFQVTNLDTESTILPDGTIILPKIEAININHLTLDQARSKIENSYKRVLKNPVTYVDLIQRRPVRVSVTGEVYKPGIYSLGDNETNSITDGSTQGTQVKSSGWPTLVEAIQKAGGITDNGDLKKVKLSRYSQKNETKKETIVNYWRILNEGGYTENPLLHDGDSIRIPKTEEKTKTEMITIARSSFAPDYITVQITGEVINPGEHKIKASMPLSKAISKAGGLSTRAKRSKVTIIRLKDDGDIQKLNVKYDESADLNSKENPSMQSGDIVVVSRNGWAKTTDGIKSIIEPIGPIINAGSLFRLLK